MFHKQASQVLVWNYCPMLLMLYAGGTPPRRISTIGFCIGGSVATLAATWAAVQWPTADVRCISFGAPAVGNASFVAAFRSDFCVALQVMRLLLCTSGGGQHGCIDVQSTLVLLLMLSRCCCCLCCYWFSCLCGSFCCCRHVGAVDASDLHSCISLLDSMFRAFSNSSVYR